MVQSSTAQSVLELFDPKPKASAGRKGRSRKELIRRRLSEVICGIRPAIQVYSRRLQSPVWFVNEGMVDPASPDFDGQVITMSRLADLLHSGDPFRHMTGGPPGEPH